MKKALSVIGLIILSAVVGGLTAMIVGRRTAGDTPHAVTHYTAFQQGDYPDLTYAAENAVQGVVNIEVTQLVNVERPVNNIMEFFGYSLPNATLREQRSGGSGVIISPDGYVVTNEHVIENARKLRVNLYDGRTFGAEIIGTDPATDVALLKIDGHNLPSLPFGNSDTLRLGEWVLAIGSPFDLHSTITAGIVSAKSRNLGATENIYGIESYIQTDAAVNPGNSGGALVDTRGELVGINTLIKSPTGSYSGYSFAVPVSIVEKVVGDLKNYGIAQRALLGVSYIQIDGDFIEAYGDKYGINRTGGFYVAEVDHSGAAKAAGIHEGDIIIAVDDVELGNSSNLSEVISRFSPNDKVKISVKRDGQVKHFDLTLRNKAGKAELLDKDYVDIAGELGGGFAEIDDATRSELNIDHGVRVVEIERGGILAEAGVKRGFIITEINEIPIRKVDDFNRIASKIVLIEGVYPDGRSVGYSLVQ